ncbi:MAG: hypothetical protein HFJ46_02370 [Clostridia bacterium]|nr:hypothetical protein [Clostridia bacterium]
MRLKNNRGVTLSALVITIIVMLILAGASIVVLVPKDSAIDSANAAKIYTNIAGIEESIGILLTDENSIDDIISNLENESSIMKIVNSSNQELYWITKEGMTKLAPGYANGLKDELVEAKVDTTSGKIKVNSLESLLNTEMYVMDRELKVSYIADKVYGDAEFRTGNSEPKDKWWKVK